MIFTKRISLLMLSIAITIVIGISSRVYPIGLSIYDEYLGDALYAVLFYLLLKDMRGFCNKFPSRELLRLRTSSCSGLTHSPETNSAQSQCGGFLRCP